VDEGIDPWSKMARGDEPIAGLYFWGCGVGALNFIAPGFAFDHSSNSISQRLDNGWAIGFAFNEFFCGARPFI
jgi:hypothetical protein